jgi:hypothetical protein
MTVYALLSRGERSTELSYFLVRAREVEGTSEAYFFLAILEKKSNKSKEDGSAKGF